MSPILTFDIDGVLTDGRYIPPELRTAEYYITIPILPGAATAINKLSSFSTIYFVSSRRTGEPVQYTKLWLEHNGVEMQRLGGVICDITPLHKAILCTSLGSRLHFDDDPRAVAEFRGDRAVFVEGGEWTGEIVDYCRHYYPIVRGWPEIYRVATSVLAGQSL